MNQAKLYWESEADAWKDEVSDPDSYFHRRTLLILDLIDRHIQTGTALDIGCGTGLLSYGLTRRGFEAYGTDISENMIDKSRQLLSSEIPNAHSRFDVLSHGGIPFDIKFDLITSIGVLPYVEDYDQYIHMIAESIVPGGYVVSTSTNRISLYTMYIIMDHISQFKHNREWYKTLINLMRTGLWSGGYVNYNTSNQYYSSLSFDRAFRRHGLQLCDEFNLFNIERFGLDAHPLERSSCWQWLARHLAWNHIGMYRKM